MAAAISNALTSPLDRLTLVAAVCTLLFVVLAILLVVAAIASSRRYGPTGALPVVIASIAAVVFFAQAVVAAVAWYYLESAKAKIENAVTTWTSRAAAAVFGFDVLRAIVDRHHQATAPATRTGAVGVAAEGGGAGGSGAANRTDAAPSFASDVKSLFRPSDVATMKQVAGLDLHNYDDVKAHASRIDARLNDAARPMPCDGPWPQSQRDLFRRWIDTGMQA